ncbi:Swi3-domain-containing protein [Schizophyllum commune H4-8]|uniref:Chromosome segregation in meiosis protein n=1 Tax=Schizophyllum commune (strain H4-8 / FGSC 9210) TaxID=578458 RepID=D8PTC5_SCHCM|nr:Swi3-domain-containing protein [Schizophyllum commune H4-8]KAI5899348.1 Swi3-domain-containing protein [Schizophyllum commune H4-8]
MAALDAIWDDDAELASTSRPGASEDNVGKSSEPLFIYGDESDTDKDTRAPNAAGGGMDDAELEAMFDEGALEMIDARAIQAKAEEAVRREEARRPKKKPAERHQILPSSSPPPEGFDDHDAGGAKAGKDGEKKRRKPIVLDESRLISPIGFPQLIEDTKNFKIKGKGHEATDLNRLLNIYQFWAHRMYPRTQFNDTVERIEKLCHSRRMHNQLGMMRDAAFGKAPKEDAIDLSDSDNDDARERPQNGITLPSSSSPRSSPPARSRASSSRPPSLPPDSSDPGDAVMTDGTRSSAAPDNDEDAELWAAIEEDNNAMLSAKAPAPRRPPTNDFDDDMDDAFAVFDEVHGAGGPPPAPPPPPEFDMDDDFAMMDEIEAEQRAAPQSSSAPAKADDQSAKPAASQNGAAATAPNSSPPKPRTTSDVEDEWNDDDMYADD